jgi:predicted regulator of Ras-like GTPase activity (Roadblock/LC7/MglB family)
MAEVEEALKRLTAHKGVTQAVIVNSDGIPIRTVPAAMEPKDATMFPAVLLPVVQKSRQMVAALAKLEGIDNSFNSIRLRSKKNEILVYPEVRTERERLWHRTLLPGASRRLTFSLCTCYASSGAAQI